MKTAGVEMNTVVVGPSPAVVFWMLEGPRVLRSADASAPVASGGREVAPLLSAEAIWLLLEGSGSRVVPPVERAA